MDEKVISDVVHELSDLVDEQMKALLRDGFPRLSDEDLKEYEARRKRIAMLGSIVWPN